MSQRGVVRRNPVGTAIASYGDFLEQFEVSPIGASVALQTVLPFGLESLSNGNRAMNEHYLEDVEVGQKFKGTKRIMIDRDSIKRFAAQFDPQPFHLDEQAAAGTIFGGLAASGWHTAAITMRLLVESPFKPAGGIIGAGFEELRWPRPVRAGDELRVESEVLEVRASRNRPDQGIVKVKTTTLNQKDEPVQVSVGSLIVLRRSAS